MSRWYNSVMVHIPLAQYEKLKQETLGKAEIIAVSKQRPNEQVLAWYDQGIRDFAENRLSGLQSRSGLPDDIRWHFIGHLQRNKVRQTLPYIDVLSSLDSVPLALLLQKECARSGRVLPVLAEFHLARSDTAKSGLPAEEALPFFELLFTLPALSPQGIMVMGPHTDDTDAVRQVFAEGAALYRNLQAHFGKERIRVLSMGMSDDYRIALECGANQIRIGSLLFDDSES